MTVQVTVSCKESPGVHLDVATLPTTFASSVFKRFCRRYSLSEQDCQLSCDGQVVELEKKLHEFPGSSTGTVCLEATLRPSAALHIWQAYHQANLSGANVKYLAGIWEGAKGPCGSGSLELQRGKEKEQRQGLVSSKSLPSSDTADNIATLLRLQGLSRISGLLCPVLRPTAASADECKKPGGRMILPMSFLRVEIQS
ncbi:hypothetical protein WJX82_001882 [Trebouxia sp. C0006]